MRNKSENALKKRRAGNKLKSSGGQRWKPNGPQNREDGSRPDKRNSGENKIEEDKLNENDSIASESEEYEKKLGDPKEVVRITERAKVTGVAPVIRAKIVTIQLNLG